MSTGSKMGLLRLATIRGYNGDGTVTIGLNGDPSGPLSQPVPLPAAWVGQEGQFMGGYPSEGAPIIVSQSQGGQWYIVSFINSTNVSTEQFISSDSTKLSALRDGRALIQVRPDNRIIVDPESGTEIGNADSFLHINPIRNIISHNYKEEMSFTESARHVNGIIKRDLQENANRGLLGSAYDSHVYDSYLKHVCMDPKSPKSILTFGGKVRNPPLVEKRDLVYEFAHSYYIESDENELEKYSTPKFIKKFSNSRTDIRADALSLSLHDPNHLIETIKGTAIDAFGNILDINKSALPIGKIDSLSFTRNTDKQDAYTRIRAELRKSLAYHFELNARKGTAEPEVLPPPNVVETSATTDYGRDRSRFTFDIDKEGQFKLNVPASSESGNIPLLTRSANFSAVIAPFGENDANEFLKSDSGQEIYLENFGHLPSIKLSATDSTLDGYASPIDLETSEPIKYGTTHHDIRSVCSEFQVIAPRNQANPPQKLIEWYEKHPLNDNLTDLDYIIKDKLTVSGSNADAGGRSGAINLDGFLSLNIGANTVDRQSLWMDCAGGVVSRVGRDKQGISYAGSMDGDVLIQIGGPGIGNTVDSRFSDQNDAYRNGTLDVRVAYNGQVAIFRIGVIGKDSMGIDIVSPGTIMINSKQDMIFKSRGSIKFDAQNISFHTEFNGGRIVQKGGPSI